MGHQGLGGPHRWVIKVWEVLVGGSSRSGRSSLVGHQGLGGPHRKVIKAWVVLIGRSLRPGLSSSTGRLPRPG